MTIFRSAGDTRRRKERRKSRVQNGDNAMNVPSAPPILPFNIMSRLPFHVDPIAAKKHLSFQKFFSLMIA
jgi:hypothetical protein